MGKSIAIIIFIETPIFPSLASWRSFTLALGSFCHGLRSFPIIFTIWIERYSKLSVICFLPQTWIPPFLQEIWFRFISKKYFKTTGGAGWMLIALARSLFLVFPMDTAYNVWYVCWGGGVYQILCEFKLVFQTQIQN